MATTIAAAPLSITVTESIVINGQSMGGSNTLAIADVTEVFKRIVTVPTTEVTLYSTHDTDVGGSVFDDDLVKYVRITNKDDTNFISLRITSDSGGSDEFVYKLNAGESFLLYSHDTSMTASTGVAGAVDANIESVEALADTAEVDCELFVASI
jgi:hypothetical protein